MQEISKTINWLTGGAYGGRGRGWGGSHREIFARVRVRGPRTASCPLLVRPRPFQRRDLPERLIPDRQHEASAVFLSASSGRSRFSWFPVSRGLGRLQVQGLPIVVVAHGAS